MYKRSNMLAVCAWVIVIVFTCALLMNGLAAEQRMVLLLAVCATAWVYMACESRVLRAHAPLVIREEPAKPPEQEGE